MEPFHRKSVDDDNLSQPMGILQIPPVDPPQLHVKACYQYNSRRPQKIVSDRPSTVELGARFPLSDNLQMEVYVRLVSRGKQTAKM